MEHTFSLYRSGKQTLGYDDNNNEVLGKIRPNPDTHVCNYTWEGDFAPLVEGTGLLLTDPDGTQHMTTIALIIHSFVYTEPAAYSIQYHVVEKIEFVDPGDL